MTTTHATLESLQDRIAENDATTSPHSIFTYCGLEIVQGSGDLDTAVDVHVQFADETPATFVDNGSRTAQITCDACVLLRFQDESEK